MCPNQDILSSFLFYQVNAGKGGPNMEIVLQQAWELAPGIVSVKESWENMSTWRLYNQKSFELQQPHTH